MWERIIFKFVWAPHWIITSSGRLRQAWDLRMVDITATVDRLRDLPPAIIDLEVEKILLPKTRSKVVLHDRALFVTELHREHLWPASVRSRAGRRA